MNTEMLSTAWCRTHVVTRVLAITIIRQVTCVSMLSSPLIVVKQIYPSSNEFNLSLQITHFLDVWYTLLEVHSLSHRYWPPHNFISSFVKLTLNQTWMMGVVCQGSNS